MWANMWFTLSAHNKGQVFEKGKQTRNMWDSSRFDLTLLLLFFFKDVSIKKKKVPNGICYFMKISQHQKHSGTRHTWEVKLTLCQQRAVTHRCGWCRQGEESWLLTSLHFHSEGLPN